MSAENVVAIVQARMGSTRLPGKVLMSIENKPILKHIIDRLSYVEEINQIVVATSDKNEDDDIELFCKDNDISCIRGSENNVLQRFGIVSKTFPADIYIRATGDNPMIDINLIRDMLSFFIEKKLTYTCYKNYPLGSGVEIFTSDALKETLVEANLDYELEHVTPYMYQRMKDRRVEYYVSEEDKSGIRMTIDTEQDFEFAKAVFSKLYKSNHCFGIVDVERLLDCETGLRSINSQVHQKVLGE